MNQENLKKQTITSLIWKLFERFGAQAIQFVVSIILARLLSPSDYGAIALIIVFINVATVFVQGGFSSALIRKLDADALDYNTVFWTNLIMSVVLYVILFFCAPLIAEFYKMPILKDVLRVLSLTLIVGTINSIQNVILQKNLQFKKIFVNSIFGTLISAGVGIGMAYANLGVWALVGQQLSMVVATTFIMFFTVKWFPKFQFSLKRLKKLFSFGWKLLLSGLLNQIYNNIYSLIIGKKYTDADLGYWNRGKQFPSLIIDNISGSISSVMYPVLSFKQNDKKAMREILRKSLKATSFLIFPMMAGLAVCAEPLVRLLLTDKWLPCVFFLQMWCLSYAFYPLAVGNLQVYNALGRSDIFLGLEIAKKIIGVATLLIALPFGLKWMMIANVITSFILAFINAFPNKKLLGYGYIDQMKDILPSAVLSIAMAGAVYGLSYLPIHYAGVLAIQVFAGIIIYPLLAKLFKLEAYTYAVEKISKAKHQVLVKLGKAYIPAVTTSNLANAKVVKVPTRLTEKQKHKYVPANVSSNLQGVKIIKDKNRKHEMS